MLGFQSPENTGSDEENASPSDRFRQKATSESRIRRSVRSNAKIRMIRVVCVAIDDDVFF